MRPAGPRRCTRPLPTPRVPSEHSTTRPVTSWPAGEVDRAFRLIVEPAWELLDRGEVVAARQWLDLLPDGVIGTDVDRILAYLVLLTAAGRVEEVDRWIGPPRSRAAARTSVRLLQQVQFDGCGRSSRYIRGRPAT